MSKYLPWMSILLAASLGVVGCGDDDDDSTNATGGKSTGGATSGKGGSSSGGSSSGGSSTGGAGQMKDIVDTAVAAGSFTKLAEALTAADLVDALKGKGPFTVFAPTDTAFADFEKANPGVLGALEKAELAAVLTYHVVPDATVKSGDLKDDQVVITLNGSPLLVDLTGGAKVGASAEAKVTAPDVLASNGVIHVIDKIILPPAKDIVETAVEAGTFTTLAGALTAADLVATLQGDGPFTVFAPTDQAFEKLAAVPSGDALKDVLLYHVVSGAIGSGDLTAGKVPTLLTGNSVDVKLTGGVQINASKVTAANIIAKNGVIHVIDTVLVPD